MEDEVSFLADTPALAWDVADFKIFFLYLGCAGSVKAPETCNVQSLASLDYNAVNFYQKQLTGPWKMPSISMTSLQQAGAGTSRWWHHLSFLFAPFLAYQASHCGKSGVFGIVER